MLFCCARAVGRYESQNVTTNIKRKNFEKEREIILTILLSLITQVGFAGRITCVEISQKAAIDSAKSPAISTILNRIGSKVAQDIERAMELMRFSTALASI